MQRHRLTRFKTGLIAAVGIVMVGTLAACGGGSDDTLARIKEDKIVRVGFANEAPFAYSDSQGQLQGFMPVSMEYIFDQIGGIKLEGVLTDFNGLIPALRGDRVDVVGAGLYINAERCEQATPSNPQYTAAEGMAVLAGNPQGIASYGDVAEAGIKFGTVSGSINRDYALDSGVSQDNVVLFPNVSAALSGLKSGRVDAVGMSVISLQDVMSKEKDERIELVDDFTAPDGANAYGSVYFRSSDEDLVEAYNEELAKALESGELLKLYQELGFDEKLLPPEGVVAAELCKE